MAAAVFDTGALDELLDERTRRIFVEEFRRSRSVMVVPAVVVTEFLGHQRDLVRAERVLKILQPISVEPADGARAALLLDAVRRAGVRARPSVIDATVAALAERFGMVVTNDPDDFHALAGAGAGFHVVNLQQLRVILGRQHRARRSPRR